MMTPLPRRLNLFLLALFLLFLVAAATPTPQASSPKNPVLRIELHHRNSSSSSTSYVEYRMEQDVSRRRWIKSRSGRSSSRQEEKALSIPMGNPFVISEYVIVGRIGDPPITYTFQIDTGSDLSWLQCIPCESCFEQYGDIYDPSQSRAGSVVMWTDPLCQSLREYKQYKGENGECRYELAYADSSQTKGYLRLDKLTLTGLDASSSYSNTVPIGCGVNQNEYFHGRGPAGILGLSNAPYSLVSYLNLVSYSYCLVDPIKNYDPEASSTLVLNDTAPPQGDPNTIFIDLVRQPSENFLYVNLTEISVDDILVPIPDGTFRVRPDDGEGGVILDSGTFYTYLTAAAYNPLRTLFQQQTLAPTTEDPRFNPVQPYDLCFDRIDLDKGFNPYPIVTFYFDENIPVTLRLENYIKFNVSVLIDCFTILPEVAGEMRSTIGITQQYGSRFYFDLHYDFIAIKPNQC